MNVMLSGRRRQNPAAGIQGVISQQNNQAKTVLLLLTIWFKHKILDEFVFSGCRILIPAHSGFV